jgi:hypothetical protein
MINDVEIGEQYTAQEPVQETQPQQEAQAPKKESNAEQNWRAMRDRAWEAERKAAEYERILASQQKHQQAPQNQTQDDDFDISDDSYVEGKGFKKYVRSLKQEIKDTRAELQQQRERMANDQAEFRLKTEFNDFYDVVTKDNIEKLASKKPSLYKTIMSNKDVYDQGYAAYEMIKNSGILEDRSAYEDQDRRLEQNKSRPRSAATASPQANENPLQRVGEYDRRILTEDRKEQLRRQVEEAKRLR